MSTKHIPDHDAPGLRPHHYMNADGTCHAGDLFEAGTPHVVLYDAKEVVRVVNYEIAAAKEQHRHEWASYIENWSAAVGPMPPTVDLIVKALRADSLPFGCSAADGAA